MYEKYFNNYDTKSSDYSIIKNLPNLKRLNISNNDIKDISFLKGLEHLRHLKIYENNISDYSPINNVKKVIK